MACPPRPRQGSQVSHSALQPTGPQVDTRSYAPRQDEYGGGTGLSGGVLGAHPGRARRETAWRLVLGVAGIAVAVFLAGLAVFLLSTHTRPSDFAPAGIERASPGTLGCRSTAGEVCYEALFQSGLSGLTLSHLQFEVTNVSPATTTGPLAPPIPLGPGAQVAVLDSSTSIAGVWNVSNGQWQNGSTWLVPTGPYVPVILDTGLVSNSTLSEAEFAIVLTSPFEGALGFPLP